MTIQRECVLEVFSIKSDHDREIYNQNLSKFKFYNPFNNIELMQSLNAKKRVLQYFILSKNGQPLVTMPFYLRKIKIKLENKNYYDVISPYGYSGPYYNDCNESYLQCFWKLVDEWYKENDVISEFIRFNLKYNYKYYTGLLTPTLINVRGEIINPNELWDKFKAKVRNNYRKATNNGLVYKLFYDDINEKVIDTFYSIYISTMERNEANENYYFKKEYFLNLALGNKNRCAIAMIYKDDIPISTEFILLSKDTAYSYLGGTLAEFFNSRPNDFLKFNTIKWLYEHKLKYYVLGGGRKNGDGLFNYKKSFFSNDDDVIYYTGQKIINEIAYNKLIELSFEKHNIDKKEIEDITYFPTYRVNEILITEK